MECTMCEEPITNPLCPDCLGQAVSAWLNEQRPRKVAALQNLTNSWKSQHGEHCIRCGQSFVLCTYCYTKDVFNWLRDGELQVQFLRHFDFLSQNA